jgi:hypothetical protein
LAEVLDIETACAADLSSAADWHTQLNSVAAGGECGMQEQDMLRAVAKSLAGPAIGISSAIAPEV